MAVKINFTSKAGESGDYVNFDPQIANKTKIHLKMKYWKDKTTRDTEGAIPFNDQLAGSSSDRINGFQCNYIFDYDLNSADNIYKQAYAYLKTLPEFDGAEDC
jgi:hypothetical protein